ncbi:MAG: type II toxin-antitoxin system death-on-curing family toxin [Trueperaceae bacterium]|nr:type II toxin-antitoxin system death-on-curing family toxin [Trueperaceae bacterium]
MSSPNSEKAYNYRYRGKVYPTLGSVLEANREALDADIAEVLNRSGLESAVNAPIESAGNEDAYPYFFDKIAAVAYRIIANHVFADGNKRTALSTIELTLNWNNHYIRASDETFSLAILLVASGHLDSRGLKDALLYMCGYDPAVHSQL